MIHLFIDKIQIGGQDARDSSLSQGLMAMIGRMACILFLAMTGPVLAKDQVSPKRGAIPNGLFASEGKERMDFAIVGCRQTYDVLKCVIQLVEAKADDKGQCRISVRQIREDLPWQTMALDASTEGHWAVVREQPSSRCKVSRSITFSRSKEKGRMDVMRFTRLVAGADDHAFCKKIPELEETWIQDPNIVKVPGCDSFRLDKQ